MKMNALIAVVLCLLVSAAACTTPKKAQDTLSATENSGGPSSTPIDANTLGDSDSGKAMGMQTIHFAYDSFALTSEAKTALKSNAQILKDKPSAKIQIEGHCDSHGGIQYNIALGEKRANAVKKMLEGMGIKGERISTISYGKERPVASGDSDEARAQNRRANFVITSR